MILARFCPVESASGLAEVCGILFQVNGPQQFLDGLSAHSHAETAGAAVLLHLFPVLLLGQDLLILQAGGTGSRTI